MTITIESGITIEGGIAIGKIPLPPPPIGAPYGGGFFAGQISTAGNGIADYNLIIGPVLTTQTQQQWKTTTTTTAGTNSVIDGPANTAAMVAAGNHPAAQYCAGLTIGGYNDWYMPAKNELEICYFNLKPGPTLNNISAGINPNAVPPRASNYTTGNPAQTNITIFRTGGIEAYVAGDYWSSTEISATFAWFQNFNPGNQNGSNKTTMIRVRAVRRVPA